MANYNIDESSELGMESFDSARFFQDYASALGMGGTFSVGQINNFISTLGLASYLDTRLDTHMDLESVLGMLSAEEISVVLEFLEVFGLGSIDDIQRFQHLVFLSSIFLDSQPDLSANYAVNLAAALTLRSVAAYGVPLDEVSSMGLASMFEARYNVVLEHLSTMQVASEEGLSANLQMVLFSTVGAASEATTQLDANIDFESMLGAMSVFQIGEDVYEGWVLSVEDFGYTEYENYPFTGVASLKGKPYALAEDGLYLLEGDQDEGSPIAAALRTGLFDFNSKALKDAKSVYLGYTSNGQLVVKAITTGRGKKREDWYRLKKTPGGDFDMNRATIQRGLRSTYWQFEICNVDGADFDIDDVTIVYNVLSRRIR